MNFKDWINEKEPLRLEMAKSQGTGGWKMLGKMTYHQGIVDALAQNPGGLDINGLIKAMGDIEPPEGVNQTPAWEYFQKLGDAGKYKVRNTLRSQLLHLEPHGKVRIVGSRPAMYYPAIGRPLKAKMQQKLGREDILKNPGELIRDLRLFWDRMVDMYGVEFDYLHSKDFQGEAASVIDKSEFNMSEIIDDLRKVHGGSDKFKRSIIYLMSMMVPRFSDDDIGEALATGLDNWHFSSADGMDVIAKIVEKKPQVIGMMLQKVKKDDLFRSIIPKLLNITQKMIQEKGPMGMMVAARIARTFPPKLKDYANLFMNLAGGDK